MSNAVIEYLKSLIPHVQKDEVLEDLRITEAALKDVVIPSYVAAATFFSSEKFKSRDNQKIDQTIRGIIKESSYGRPATFLSDFARRLQVIELNIDVVTKLINRELARDVIMEGVSSHKVVLVRIAEKMSYISRFALDLLNLIYINEAAEGGADSRSISMSPAEMARAHACIEPLAYLVMSYSIDSDDFEKMLNKSPDLMLSAKNDNPDVEAMYTEQDLDPVTSPLVQNFAANPIYHIRMAVADWQINRYKSTKEKKNTIDLRLQLLQLQRERMGSNPNLERQIAYYQDLASGLDRKLARVEQELEIKNAA